MMSYFKPLRRKIGVVTLVMTCALMAGWIRSLTKRNAFEFVSGGWCATLASDQLGLSWTRNQINHGFNQPTVQRSAQQTPGLPAKWRISRDNPFGDLMMNGWETKWRIDRAGFHFGEMYLPPMSRPILIPDRTNPFMRLIDVEKTSVSLLFWIIPHWSIVIPLTLLSAWLLLSKPKPRKPSFEQQANA